MDGHKPNRPLRQLREPYEVHVLVSVDPGKRDIWWAHFNAGGYLEKCGRLKVKSAHQVAQWFGHHYPQLVLAIEKPMIRKGGRFGQARPSDIIDLAVSVGWVQAAPWLEVAEYLPSTWKGNVPKDLHNRRTLAALSRSELAVLDSAKIPQSLQHNVVDACGIGLFHLKAKGFR